MSISAGKHDVKPQKILIIKQSLLQNRKYVYKTKPKKDPYGCYKYVTLK